MRMTRAVGHRLTGRQRAGRDAGHYHHGYGNAAVHFNPLACSGCLRPV
jgi:hypothetical protein